MTAPTQVALRVPPGNPTALSLTAADIGKSATAADKHAAQIRTEVSTTLSRAAWTGDAADAFATNMRALADRVKPVGPALQEMADALSDYATTLARVQREARAAILLADSAQQGVGDPATYDKAVADVNTAWRTYESAGKAAAARIKAAQAKLPFPAPDNHPAPAHHHWYDGVGHWFKDRGEDIKHGFQVVGQDAVNFVEYLGSHPDELGRLVAEAGTTAIGVLLTEAGAAGEAGGIALDATGVGALAGVPINVASAGLIAAGLSMAAGGAAAGGQDLSRMYSEAQAEGESIPEPPDPAAADTRGLGQDPATGQWRQSEFETGTRIEDETGVRLTRAPKGARYDWSDENGVTYDAVGNFDSQYFDQQWPKLQGRIIDHLDKANVVPVDVSRFTPEQIAQVKEFVAPLGPRVIVIGG